MLSELGDLFYFWKKVRRKDQVCLNSMLFTALRQKADADPVFQCGSCADSLQVFRLEMCVHNKTPFDWWRVGFHFAFTESLLPLPMIWFLLENSGRFLKDSEFFPRIERQGGNNMSEGSIAVQTRIPESAYRFLDSVAREQCSPKGTVLRRIILDWCRNQKTLNGDREYEEEKRCRPAVQPIGQSPSGGPAVETA